MNTKYVVLQETFRFKRKLWSKSDINKNQNTGFTECRILPAVPSVHPCARKQVTKPILCNLPNPVFFNVYYYNSLL